MARIDVDIEDYLGEVDTDKLVDELKTRKKFRNFNFDKPNVKGDKLSELKELLGLRPYATKDEIIREINEL